MIADLPPTDDATLVARAVRGESAAFETLYQRHFTHVLNFAYGLCNDRNCAEDAAQEAFLKAHKRLSSLREPQAFLRFLFKTVQNQRLDQARSAKRRPLAMLADLFRSKSGEFEEGIPDPAIDLSAGLVVHERDRALRLAVGKLPAEFRDPIVLHHFVGLDLVDIAERLGLPEGTVKSRLARGRERLRRAMTAWQEQ